MSVYVSSPRAATAAQSPHFFFSCFSLTHSWCHVARRQPCLERLPPPSPRGCVAYTPSSAHSRRSRLLEPVAAHVCARRCCSARCVLTTRKMTEVNEGTGQEQRGDEKESGARNAREGSPKEDGAKPVGTCRLTHAPPLHSRRLGSPSPFFSPRRTRSAVSVLSALSIHSSVPPFFSFLHSVSPPLFLLKAWCA